ncbi:hypothetical protein D9M68_929950 [compost metagenome]
MIVFGGSEDVAIELGHLLLPALGNLVLRRHPGGRGDLVEEGQREIPEVDDFDLDIGVGFCDPGNPLHRRVGEACGARRADDDGDLGFGHGRNLSGVSI